MRCAIILVTFILISCSSQNDKASEYTIINNLKNTTWTFEVTEGCVDSIKFLSLKKFSYYYCGAGFIYDGNYSRKGDTIYTEILDYVSQIDASKGKSITCKLDFEYKDNKLCVVKKWEEYSMFTHLYRTQCFDIFQK